MQLTDVERNSAVWLKLSGHMNDLLAEARRKNESLKNDEKQTIRLRARIELLKSLLNTSDKSAAHETAYIDN